MSESHRANSARVTVRVRGARVYTTDTGRLTERVRVVILDEEGAGWSSEHEASLEAGVRLSDARIRVGGVYEAVSAWPVHLTLNHGRCLAEGEGEYLESWTHCNYCRALLWSGPSGIVCPNHRYCGWQVLDRLLQLSKPWALSLRDEEKAFPVLAARRNWNEESLFDLTPKIIRQEAPWVSQNAVDHIMHDLDRARHAPLVNILDGLLSRPTSNLDRGGLWDLCNTFGTIEKLAEASDNALGEALAVTALADERLAAIMRQRVTEWFQVDWHHVLLKRWRESGVEMVHRRPRDTLAGLLVGTVGSPSWTRRATDMVMQEGGRTKYLAPRPRYLAPRRDDLDDVVLVVVQDSERDLPESARPEQVVVGERGLANWIEQQQSTPLTKDHPALVLQDRDDPASAMWRRVLVAHPKHLKFGQRGRLPLRSPEALQTGALYLYTPLSMQILVVVADNLKAAMSALESAEDEIVFDRTRAIWALGGRDEIRASSPLLRAGVSALQEGRPILVRQPSDWGKVPHVAGIYRIHRQTDEGKEIYVGRSQDLRRRPGYRHEKTAGLPWSDGSGPGLLKIEIMRVKGVHRYHVWTVTDLDDSEAKHIERMQRRFAGDDSVTVLNVTGGRNGPPSRPGTSVYVWKAETEA